MILCVSVRPIIGVLLYSQCAHKAHDISPHNVMIRVLCPVCDCCMSIG